jgi:hypothetical protein
MGSEEVADIFRMQHLRRYDELRLQYLRTKVKQMAISAAYEPFLPFEDRSSLGCHGFTPSGQWLRDAYDTFIESYRDVLNRILQCVLHGFVTLTTAISLVVFFGNPINRY